MLDSAGKLLMNERTHSSIASLWRSEDWWAVWLGMFILALAATQTITRIPSIHTWTADLSMAIKIEDAPYILLLGFGILVLTTLPLLSAKGRTKSYWTGFPILFLLAFLSQLLAKQTVISEYGLAYALWALVFGLLIGNTVGTPNFLKSAAKAELFIKIGLVVLGAEILFDVILKAGYLGLFEVTVGLATIWYFSYYLAMKLGLTKTFAATMANATSVCGVSAAIAAGGAVKADQKEIGYTISLVLLFAAPMIVLMPLIGRMLGIPDIVFGAWVGGTIDNTASVVAAGALYSDAAMNIASVVKLSQNVLIGVTAFLLALYWVLRVEREGKPEKPKLIEIWYRFPKFIVGFLIASLIFSFILLPTMGIETVNSILKVSKGFRGWFFALTFVSIGLQTNIRELAKIGRGRPLLVFLAATAVDTILSLATAYIFFGGLFFPSPIPT